MVKFKLLKSEDFINYNITVELHNIFSKCNKANKFPLHNPISWYQSCDYILAMYNNIDGMIGYMLINDYTNSYNLLTDNDKLFNSQYSPKGIYIEQIAVLPQYQNKRLGTMLLTNLINFVKTKLSTKHIYSHVAVDNKQSLKFHCKNGFIPIGDYRSDNFYGYENYHSLLFELTL